MSGARREPAGQSPSAVVEADLTTPASLVPALEGMDEVYYLVHSMEPGGGQGFAERDRVAAENYVRVAREAGVRRTIYLGGIGGAEGSEHLASRREVETLLADAGPEFVALRASMIVGAGSASFGTLVRIVSRLPVLALPAWRERRTQPVAIEDVVACLVAARHVQPGAYDIAGPDALTFAEMTKVIAGVLGARTDLFRCRSATRASKPRSAALITGEERELLEPLMAGLHADLIVEHNRAREVFGVEPTPFEVGARRAIQDMPDVVAAAWAGARRSAPLRTVAGTAAALGALARPATRRVLGVRGLPGRARTSRRQCLDLLEGGCALVLRRVGHATEHTGRGCRAARPRPSRARRWRQRPRSSRPDGCRCRRAQRSWDGPGEHRSASGRARTPGRPGRACPHPRGASGRRDRAPRGAPWDHGRLRSPRA